MWHVMKHYRPAWVGAMLHWECQREPMAWERSGGIFPEPFDFYVPFLHMRPDATDEVRDIFRHFVFIRCSDERLRRLLTSEWNLRTRLRLFHYRDREGRAIAIHDDELEQLRTTILSRQLQVYFGLPVESVGQMAVGDRVTLRMPGWKGREGMVERIRLHRGRASMVVAVNILGMTKSVHFANLHDGDVSFADRDTEQLLTGNLVANIEDQLVTILGHWFRNPTADKKRRDYPRLVRLFSYAGVAADDPADRLRLSSLMLVCATLLGEREAAARLRFQLEQEFGGTPATAAPRSWVEAYMQLALFVATQDPRLRDAAKAYRKAHADFTPPIVGRLINQVRNAPTRRQG